MQGFIVKIAYSAKAIYVKMDYLGKVGVYKKQHTVEFRPSSFSL